LLPVDPQALTANFNSQFKEARPFYYANSRSACDEVGHQQLGYISTQLNPASTLQHVF
jgi:hypothetical protein